MALVTHQACGRNNRGRTGTRRDHDWDLPRVESAFPEKSLNEVRCARWSCYGQSSCGEAAPQRMILESKYFRTVKKSNERPRRPEAKELREQHHRHLRTD